MNNNKILNMPMSETYQPEQALKAALQADLSDVMVIGYDKDGSLFVCSSRINRGEALFLLKKAEFWALDQ